MQTPSWQKFLLEVASLLIGYFRKRGNLQEERHTNILTIRDLMYSVGIRVNYTAKAENIKCSYYKEEMVFLGGDGGVPGVTISQYRSVSNQCVVHLKYTQYYASIISQ